MKNLKDYFVLWFLLKLEKWGRRLQWINSDPIVVGTCSHKSWLGKIAHQLVHPS